jgi:hypothetical protein
MILPIVFTFLTIIDDSATSIAILVWFLTFLFDYLENDPWFCEGNVEM